jgi:hypothetical protein
MRDIQVANAMQNSPEARITRVAPGVRSALLSMGYFWSVYCNRTLLNEKERHLRHIEENKGQGYSLKSTDIN